MSDSNRPSQNASSKKAHSKPPEQKFYVRSGSVRWIVLASDVETAALRFVQKSLNESLISGPKPVNKKLQLLDDQKFQQLVANFDEKILVSQAGFSGDEAGMFVTSIVIKRWRNKIAALEKLLRGTS